MRAAPFSPRRFRRALAPGEILKIRRWFRLLATLRAQVYQC
jgi:hypothetical protein